jgi:bisphosphoglycerate-dependent phosphoglycerate mutase
LLWHRHYGLLQGHSKDCEYLTKLFGEEQILRWRRSYTDTPPSLNDPHLRKRVNPLTLHDSQQYSALPCIERVLHEDSLKHLEMPSVDDGGPSAESLKTCEVRAFGYWDSVS